MDLVSIVEDTDTILSTDGQTDKVKPVYPLSTSLGGGIISLHCLFHPSIASRFGAVHIC